MLKNNSIILLKPGFTLRQLEYTNSFLIQHNLKILEKFKKNLCRGDVIALYPEIYSTIADINGSQWKEDTIDYLTSGESLIFLLAGEEAHKKTETLRRQIRRRYRKVYRPRTKLSRRDFLNRSIRNIIHHVDPEEIERAIWLLFPHLVARDKL